MDPEAGVGQVIDTVVGSPSATCPTSTPSTPTPAEEEVGVVGARSMMLGVRRGREKLMGEDREVMAMGVVEVVDRRFTVSTRVSKPRVGKRSRGGRAGTRVE